MLYYKSIFRISVFILLFVNVPTTDSPKSNDFKKIFTENHFDETHLLSNGWKTIVADFLGADETDLDMELVKEILIEVGKWYRDTFAEIFEEYVKANLREVLIGGKT